MGAPRQASAPVVQLGEDHHAVVMLGGKPFVREPCESREDEGAAAEQAPQHQEGCPRSRNKGSQGECQMREEKQLQLVEARNVLARPVTEAA
ncbi:hypothetical protein ACQEV2_42180 [Streptomyces sp. CA-251387]|uniref:hypothetical protein n=1 Tax=Streptomyces sp. CA-251387 TaxID=3240064 RepID=UPI003D89E21A